nr:hypothetical protein [Tanacetum cinerariifolium]
MIYDLTYITDPRIAEAQTIQNVITHIVAYQVDDLDAYDSDCDEINTAKVEFMANLSHYGSYDLAEVHNHDNVNHNRINQAVQAMPLSEQSDIINLDNKIVNDTLTAELERYKDQVRILKEGHNVDLKNKDIVSDSCSQRVEIDNLKQTLSEHLKEKESLMQTVTLLKNDFQKKESRNIALKDNLRKLKGKSVVDEAVILHPMDPELLKVDVAPLALKLQNNRTTHSDYLKHSQEETVTLREIVEHERLLNLLNFLRLCV